MRDSIVVHSSQEKGVYFFSTDHCQRLEPGQNISNDFVPTTFSIPMNVVPRPALPTGRILDKEDLKLIFYQGKKEIPNPDPKFQA